MTMPCSSDEVPPATKRLRLTSPSSQCGLSVDEVGRICSASKEKCELEVLTQELDSLDEDAVFAQMRRCLTAGVVQPLVSTLPPLSGLYPFIMRNNVIENCVYLPPQKVAHNGFPELTENTTTDPHPAVDTARPEIALGARLEATVLQRVAHQKHQGLWSATRLPKVMEPRQGRSHHEYLIGEILWLSTDFAEERKWKKEVACHLAKSAQTYLLLRQEWNRRCRIAEERIRWRNATSIARMVKQWWMDVKNPIPTEVELLLADAALPLEKVLSPGYLDRRASHNESLPSDEISVDGELIDVDVPSSSGTESDDLELSETYSERTSVSQLQSGHLSEWKCVDSAEIAATIPPWDSRHYSEPLCRPIDLHEAALSLSPLLRSFSLWSENSISALATTGWNPAFRISALPSQNLGCAVTWLRQAFLRTLPGILLSPSPISGDSELAVAAHLGQLTVEVKASHSPPSPVSPSGSNVTGTWGPHLIVTSRLSLSSWRTRLLTWCPGLKVVCLSLGSKGDSSRKGGRLRSCVARGAVNICLTTYSALRARPSRYSQIQWNVIVFDHVHSLINQVCHAVSTTETDEHKLRTMVKPENVTKPSTCEAFCSLTTEMKPGSRVEHSSTAPLDLFTSELKCTGHRILISSVPDLCPSLCGYRLYLLSRLLLLRDPVGSSAYDSWSSELFRASTALQKKRAPQSTGPERPTKRQLIKFMEPFIVHLDEDDEWETLVDEEVVSCPMTASQSQLHDAVLVAKSACNASKTGDLLDLLRTVSLASRICSHPCLNSTQPRSSQRFQNVLEDLSTAHYPVGPFVFRIPSKDAIRGDTELLYSTPEAVVRVVLSLRDCEWPDSASTCLDLYGSMQQPRYVRDLVAGLVPTAAQFDSVFNPIETRCVVPCAQTYTRSQPFLLDGHNGVNRLGVSIQPMDDGRGDDLFRYIKSKFSHLTNGTPEQMDTIDNRDAVKQLDFANILVKGKRPRSVSGLLLPESVPQSAKKRRIEDNSLQDRKSSKRSNWSLRGSTSTVTSPFLSAELLVQLEKEIANGSYEHRDPGFQTPSSNQSTGNVRLTGRVHDSSSASAHFVNGRVDITPAILHLTERNKWKCIQSAGISDWCSAASCTFLQFDQRFLRAAQTRSVPSPGHPLTVMECLQLQLLHELSIWNLPSLYISRLPVHSLLCSRPAVIARTLLPTAPSLQSQDYSVMAHSCKIADHSNGHLSSNCKLPPLLVQPSPSCLSCTINSLYQFTERSRWLSTSQSLHPYGCFNHWAHSDGVGLTPCGRLFIESGKFRGLNQLLGSLLGSRSDVDGGKGRPRCIYLMAHQSALLDLLEGFLSASSWRSYPRIRLPCDEDLLGVRSAFLIDRINHWPYGCCSPLIVLIHSRSPPGFLSGLRAGPDTGAVICDMDWRADATDTLRFLFHSWALNGLVDVPRSCTRVVSRPVLRIYRLVSNVPANPLNASPSMEACLSRGVACRLLPRAVFHAHSSNSENASLWSARVQPNVVNELLSCGPSFRPNETRCVIVKSFSKVTDVERDFPCSIKPEAPSCSSSSSVASSFSFNAAGTDRNGRFGVYDDEPSGFREREPLSEELLNRAFELFEDPADVQAWGFSLAESSLDNDDFSDEHLPLPGITSDLQSLSLEKSDEFLCCSLDSLVHPTKDEIMVADPQDLKQQLAYSEIDSWEVAHYELREYLASWEDRIAPDSCALLTYDGMLSKLPTVFEEDISKDLLGLSVAVPAELQVWEPFLSDVQAEVASWDNRVDSRPWTMELKAANLDHKACLKFSVDFDDVDWGYESEPMTEEDLPPITVPVVTPITSTCTGVSGAGLSLKRSESSVSSSGNAHNQMDRIAEIVPLIPSTTRTPSSGQSVKRRKLVGGPGSRRGIVSEQVPPSPSALDEHTSQMHNQGDDSDVSMVPSPCSISSSRGGISVRETSSTLTGSGVTYGHGFPTCGTVSGNVGNNCNASVTIVTTVHSQTGNVNGVTSRLHIPRATYNKEVGSARNNRLRRSNTTSATNSNVAAVAAMAAGTQLGKSLSYPFQTTPNTNMEPFPNSVTLARYGHTSPGRSSHPSLSALSSLPSRYGVSQTTSVPGGNTQSLCSTSQLHVGKPLEWLPCEEAALYMCVTKIQDLSVDASNNNSSACPNFRLAEFFMNNYVPTRGYRGARQCLLMHSRMLSVVSAATAAISNGAFSFSQGAPALDVFSAEDGALSAPSPIHSITTSHGPPGRKVKNKLKSAATAAAGISGSVSQPGSLAAGVVSSSVCGNMGDNANAVSRYRAYLAYQCLPSYVSHSTGGHGGETPSNLSDSSVSAPGQLNQLLANLKTSDDNHARIVRKAVLDSLSPTHPVPSSQSYRTNASRRPLAGGLGSSHMVSLGSTYSTGSGAYSSGSGTSATLYGHHHSSSGPFPIVPLSHVGHTPTAPALLTHHRHHRHQAVHDQSPSASESGVVTGGSGTLTHTGPIIQKNPTHIAALQEHNINPDTLITPAMVIKNKEEREARMRAEALLASQLSSAAATSVCTTSTVTTTAPSSTYHPSQSNVHASDAIHAQSGQLSLQLDPSGSGIVATLPMNLSGSRLSFTHANNQRGTSVMLPVRGGFGTHSLASASTVISLAHVGGSQTQQRIPGCTSVSSTLNSGQLLSHPGKQPQQLLNSSLGRLTHFASSGTIDLMGTGPVNHPSASSGSINSTGADPDVIGAGTATSVPGVCSIPVEPESSNVVIPSSWRTSISRNFGVQNSRISSLSCNQVPNSTAIPVTAAYLTTHVNKSSVPTSYFLQQRPQFLSTSQASLSTRSILTSHSGSTGTSSMVLGGNYGSSITPLPHILRPRGTLRGSVIQPAFVRTITATSTSAVSVVPHQPGPRSSLSGNPTHSRVSLAVSSNSAPVSHLINSRTTISPGIRTQSTAIFQQLRPGNQIVSGSGGSPVTFSFSSQLGSGASAGEGRHYVSQHQSVPVHQTNNAVPSAFVSTGTSDSGCTGQKLESDSYSTRI